MPHIPSEEELESQRGPERVPLGEDWYLLEVKEYQIKKRPNIYERTEEHPEGVPADNMQVKFNVISFDNGTALYDKDGNDVSDRLAFDFIDIEKMGMKPKPSKARKFTAGCLGQPVAQALDFDSWDVLLGKRVVGHLIIKKNGKQGIDDYRPVRIRPNRAGNAAAPVDLPAAAPAAPAEDLSDKAREIFGEEAAF